MPELLEDVQADTDTEHTCSCCDHEPREIEIHSEWRVYQTAEKPVEAHNLYVHIQKHFSGDDNYGTRFEISRLVSDSSKIDPRWRDDRGSKYPKRLAKLVKKELGIALPSEFVGELHKVLEDISPRDVSIRFIDVERYGIQWNRGQWGDSNSCYWTCHSGAKDMLECDESYALQYYLGNAEEEQDDKSLHSQSAWGLDLAKTGRAWFTQGHLWNAYGPLNLRELAVILSDAYGINFKKVSLSNYGSSDNGLYINNGKGYAFGVGIDHKFHDFEIKPIEQFATCYHCECGLQEYGDNWMHIDHLFRFICHDCYSNEGYWYCETCDSELESDDEKVEHHNGVCCEHCADLNDVYRCYCCDEWIDTYGDDYSRLSDEIICSDCADGIPTCCDCNELAASYVTASRIAEDSTTIDGECYCKDCAPDIERVEPQDNSTPDWGKLFHNLEWRLSQSAKIAMQPIDDDFRLGEFKIRHGVHDERIIGYISSCGYWGIHKVCDDIDKQNLYRVVHLPTSLSMMCGLTDGVTYSQAIGLVSLLQQTDWSPVQTANDAHKLEYFVSSHIRPYMSLIAS